MRIIEHTILTLFISFFILGISTKGYSQKEISKNGIKINKLDKKNKKQGSWFWFNELGDMEISCYYKNDSIITPILFYKNQDSIFMRYPKIKNSEIFMLKKKGQWIVGNLETSTKDSLKIEIVGLYKKTEKSSFEIEEDSIISNSKDLKNEASYWLKKEIKPVYMFGNEKLNDFYYRGFSSSKFVFNKTIYVDILLTASGIIEKIDFPRNLNNLSNNEETELDYIFSSMNRWQPFFSKNKTEKFHITIKLGSSMKY